MGLVTMSKGDFPFQSIEEALSFNGDNHITVDFIAGGEEWLPSCVFGLMKILIIGRN